MDLIEETSQNGHSVAMATVIIFCLSASSIGHCSVNHILHMHSPHAVMADMLSLNLCGLYASFVDTSDVL